MITHILFLRVGRDGCSSCDGDRLLAIISVGALRAVESHVVDVT